MGKKEEKEMEEDVIDLQSPREKKKKWLNLWKRKLCKEQVNKGGKQDQQEC